MRRDPHSSTRRTSAAAALMLPPESPLMPLEMPTSQATQDLWIFQHHTRSAPHRQAPRMHLCSGSTRQDRLSTIQPISAEPVMIGVMASLWTPSEMPMSWDPRLRPIFQPFLHSNPNLG